MIIVDVETTGPDPAQHSILSIGAVNYHNLALFYQECRPASHASVDHTALPVNGFTTADLIDPTKPSYAAVMHNFADWLQHQRPDRTLCGGNIGTFDLPLISRGFRDCGITMKLGARTNDLHATCVAHMMQRGIPPPLRNGRTDLTVDDILEYTGLPREPQPHHALTGAKMEAEAFARLWEGKNLFNCYAEHIIPDYCRTTPRTQRPL